MRLLRGLSAVLIVILALAWLVAAPGSAARGPFMQGTSAPEVTAEALGQANLRGGPGIDYPVVGEIAAGTRYRVLARHALVPWLLLDYPTPGEAWVYVDLVRVTGNLALVPAVNDFAAAVSLTPTPAAPPTTGDPPVVTPTPTLSGPIATTLGTANVRFGPGLEYPLIARVPADMSYRVLAFHALVPWVQIALPESPDGTGWVYRDIVTISGDTSQTPLTDAVQVGYPTLTPTPQTVVVSGAPGGGAPAAPGLLASTLGEPLHAYLLEQEFVPHTHQFGSVFVLDLQTGDTFTLNDNVAYSGMSLTKIPILVTYFKYHTGPLNWDEAFLIADTMMCSENITSNRLLEAIGDGDPLRGAQRVTALVQRLDLNGTFIMRPFVIRENEEPINAGTLQTGVDQSSARPDLYNQILPKDLGWLLAGIYQCAQDETGLLIEHFPNDFSAQECRQMLLAMDSNAVGVFLEAGVPNDVRVIHKHGWISDTHGDAGIVIGPDGAYIFVAALYGDNWLEFDMSSPVMAELSRMTWNTFFPDALVAVTHPRTVPAECDPRDDPVIAALLVDPLPMLGPGVGLPPGVLAPR